jgi:soluble lytic murein transglycosylase-like protein
MPYTINVITQKDKSLELSKNIEKKLKMYGAPKSKIIVLTHAVKVASTTNLSGINHNWILAIIHTEDPEFKLNAQSPKGYKGLMGTPGNKTTGQYPDVDILHGVHILEEKLTETNGNMLNALTLYEGGNNPSARKHAIVICQDYQKLAKI